MFESLIRDAATRFHLGDNAGRFVRMLVDAVFDSTNGGFQGMRERFEHAGLGDLFASWIGATPADNVLQPDQFNAGFGEAAASDIASRLGVPVAVVNMAGAGLFPQIIGLLTRGGTIPSARPVDYDSWFSTSPAPVTPVATAAPATTYRSTEPVADSGGGWWKWLLALIVLGALLFFGMRSCKKDEAIAPAPVEPAATAQPAAPAAPAEKGNALFEFANTDGKVNVSGKVATDAEKTRLWDALTAAYGAPNLTGGISVDPNTLPAGWLDKLIAALPELKDAGLKFGFDGDKLHIDTAGLPDDQRFSISEKLRRLFGGLEITGLWDRASAALSGLKAGFKAEELVKALNLMSIYFDTGSATITRDSNETLTAAANAIKQAPAGTKIEVGGHTDNTGNAAANMTLSQQRADAVVARLGELGVDPGMLSAKGYGQDQPIADNNTEEGKARNRRIAFTVAK